MTQEEIIDAGIDYTMRTCPVCIGGAAFEDMIRKYNRNPAFEAGARWAKEKIIEKACKWLESIDFDVEYWNSEEGFCKEMFINEFIKTIKN